MVPASHPEDWVGCRGFVDPGYGGQDYDAEYFFYKLTGNTLYIGLQSGFDFSDGKRDDIYAGDLFLSFDGDATTYEFAIDFDYSMNPKNGLYDGGEALVKNFTTQSVSAFGKNTPLKAENGIIIANALTDTEGAYDREVDSYWATFQLDLTKILGTDWKSTGFTLDTLWTMSCGNDIINGRLSVAPVPEPTTMLLFGTGLLGLAGIVRRRLNH